MKKILIVAAIVLSAPVAYGLIATWYIGSGRYLRDQEIVLQQSLWLMRRAIDSYRQDREKPPQSLQELVDTGYMREIPSDPFTGSNKTWTIEREKESSVPNTPPGIIDVHSGADGADKEGKPYNRY